LAAKTRNRHIVAYRGTALLAAVIAIALVLSGCPIAPTQDPQPKPDPIPSKAAVSIHVFDVGEGLAVLIDDGDVEVIIDGGYKKYGVAFSEYIRPYVDGDIEYIIATHSHDDHVGGLIQIYADYQVDHTIYGDTGATGNFPKFECRCAKTERPACLVDGFAGRSVCLGCSCVPDVTAPPPSLR
jgi:glyoxylase-like metal-dependent hydrolase (beta-lactamase superfamily II)